MNGRRIDRRPPDRRAACHGKLLAALALLTCALDSLAAAAGRPDCGQALAGQADVSAQWAPRVSQGCPVFGTVEPGSRVLLDGKPLDVDPSGRVVFGVARDRTTPLRLQLQPPAGPAREVVIDVVARDWRVESITGVPRATVEPPPEIAARIAREQALVAAARKQASAGNGFAEPFAWPVQGRISGVFGSQRIYNGVPGAPHSGLDVAAPAGTPLRAPAAGVVRLAEPDLYLTGGTVLLDHGHGLTSVFLHLSRIDVEVGQRLAQGDVLGAVGATGRATGPHMHWGLNWFDVRLDPLGLPGLAPQ